MICSSSSLSLSLLPGKLPPLPLQEAHTRLQPGRGWSPDDHDHDFTDDLIILRMIMLVILRLVKIMLPSFRYWGLGCKVGLLANLSDYGKKKVLRYHIKVIKMMMVGCIQVF